jgi:hypothetical protein
MVQKKIWLPESLVPILQREAALAGRTVSGQIREALFDWAARRARQKAEEQG